MKFIKSAVLAALIAAAIGALSASVSSATEENGTVLCKKHEDPCKVKNLVTSTHLVVTPGTSPRLLDGSESGKPEIKCSGGLTFFEAEVLEPEESPTLFIELLALTNCGNSHWTCIFGIEYLSLPLLTTALNLGTATLEENGWALLDCEKISGFLPGGSSMHCAYLLEGTEFSVTGALHEGESSGDGMITAAEVPLTSEKSSGHCPEEAILDNFLIEPSDPIYLVTEVAPAESTALCKVHTGSTCKAEDQTKGLHLVTTQPSLLSSSGADVECQGSLAQADVQGLATEPKLQEVEFTKFTWEGCETHDTCSLTNKTLPIMGVERTALNLGTATASEVEVQLKCDILDGLIKLECLYAGTVGMQAEGASHKESSGNGMFTASGVTFNLVTGGSYCASSAKWDALYEPLEDVFIVS